MNTWWVPLKYQFPSSSSHSLKWHMEKAWEMLGHTSSRIYEDFILRQLFQLLSHQTTVCTQRPSCSSSRKGPGWCRVSVLFLASKVTKPDLGRDFLTHRIYIPLMEEIRRSPVEVGSSSHHLQVLYIPGGCLGLFSINSMIHCIHCTPIHIPWF